MDDKDRKLCESIFLINQHFKDKIIEFRGDNFEDFCESMQTLTCKDCLDYKTSTCHGEGYVGMEIMERCFANQFILFGGNKN